MTTQASPWRGHHDAPKGTPADVTAKLNLALRAALKDEAVKVRIAELSSEIVPMDKVTPESLRTHLTAETAKWGR